MYRRAWFFGVMGAAAAVVAAGVATGVVLGTRRDLSDMTKYPNQFGLDFHPNPFLLNF